MKVPLLDVNAQNLPLEAELKAAFERVLHSGRYILGPEVEELERQIAEMSGVRRAIGVSSGTDAILLALMALDIGRGDEVLCPSFTFFATAGCIARTGATPVFVDSKPGTFNIDVEDAANKITARTRAVVPVHLFGQAADMNAVTDLADEYGLAVVEDAAQSLGARYRGCPVGGLGTFGTFSFFPSKNLGGFGDGGMLVTNDENLADKAVILRGHGASPKYYHQYIGGNFRLDPLQAALLLVKLPHYESYTRRRRVNAAFYTERLQRLPGVTTRNGGFPNGDDPQTLVLPEAPEECVSTWNQYTLRVRGEGRRDALIRHLTETGIGSEIYYPVTMDAQECFASLRQDGSCPVASMLAKEVLSIPVYPELDPASREAVVACVASFLEAGRPAVARPA